jgi:AcrR family transcriptional regulator
MLYYHFHSKQALYRALLRQTFRNAGERLAAIAGSAAPPREKLDCAIAAIAGFISDNTHFPAIMLREIAEGGAHLDRETLGALAAIPKTVGGIVSEGISRGEFRAVDPLATYFSMLAPLVVYLAGAPIRRELTAQHVVTTPMMAPDAFVRHVQDMMRRALDTGS